MKNLSAPLLSHIGEEATTLAMCWRLALRDGITMGFTSFSEDIEFDGLTYEARSGFTPSSIQTTGSLAVDNLDVQGFLSSTGITQADIDAGRFDYAEVQIFLLNYASIDGSPPERIWLRRGRFGEVTLRDGVFVAEVRGLAQNLQQTIGETMSFTCRADFGSGEEAPAIKRCGFDLATVTVTGTITAVTSNRIFDDDTRSEAQDWFALGKLTWTSGNNVGRSMEVKRYDMGIGSPPGGSFELVEPMPENVQVGDQYSVYPGCDKKPGTCRDRYDNFLNYRGEPYVVGSDAAGRIGQSGGASPDPDDIFS